MASCLFELDEYDLDSQYHTFVTNPRLHGTEDEQDIYDLCLDLNEVVFNTILPSGAPKPLARTAEYLLD